VASADGGVDFVTKLFSLRELTARVGAVLRRARVWSRLPVRRLRVRISKVALSNDRICKGKAGMKQRRIFIFLILALLLAGGGGYVYYTRYLTPTEEPSGPTLQTATVRRGDIVFQADGSGELVTGTELDLTFRSGGVLEAIVVDVGARVRQGDILAQLETDDLEQALAEADYDVQLAEEALAEVQQAADEDALADAQADLRDAQLDLQFAQDTYASATSSSSDSVEREKTQYDWYVSQYQSKKAAFESGNLSQTDHDQAMNSMIAAEGRWKAAINRARSDELQAAENLNQARDAVNQASESLQLLETGPLTDTLTRAVLTVDQALLAREEAVAALDRAQLTAPFSGTVTAVDATVGDQVGSNTSILTLAKQQEPLVRFWVEEADMINVAVGYTVNIVFEAWPDMTFTGKVVRVDPALVTVDGTSAVQAWASLDLGSADLASTLLSQGTRAVGASQATVLLSGMTAEIEVIAAEARNALLVPVEALRELSQGQYAVFVVNPDGELEMRAVEVGLMDPVSAEVLAGLELGEIVSLGQAD
jgi:HlyD family secretion protein